MLHNIRKKYIGDKRFYKHYLFLALPMILQNAITNLVSFLDNIMVGQLGTEQMSGVAIVNQLIFVFNLAIFGVASAGSIFGAQYFGKGNHKGHMHSFRFKLYGTLLFTALAIVLFLTCKTELISLYLTDTTGDGATALTLDYALEYLAVMLFGLVPFAVTQSYATNIKETGQTLIPMLSSFVAVGVNALLDWLLIFGIGPFPKLGVMGAALATVISRYVEALVVVIWAHTHKSKNRYLKNAYTGFGIPLCELKEIVIKGFPLMLNEILWATGFITIAALMMPFYSFSHACYFTLRSGGKTMVTFLFDSVFTWVIVVPTAFVLAHFTGLGIIAVYFCVQATEVIKVIIGYFMVKSDVWLVQMV